VRIETVRNASERELGDFHPSFMDDRLPPLLLHYKARNFPKTLSEEESIVWEKWRADKITAVLPGFMATMQKLSTTVKSNDKQFVLQELQLWAESVLPADIDS
jgi:exodeoxyribonuclease-1